MSCLLHTACERITCIAGHSIAPRASFRLLCAFTEFQNISKIIVKTCGRNSQTTTSPQVLCVVQKVNSKAISASLGRFRWFAMGDNNLSCWHVLRLFHRARLLDIPDSPCTWVLNTGPKCFTILTCFILFRSLAQFLAAI